VKRWPLPLPSGGLVVSPCGKLAAVYDARAAAIQLWDVQANAHKIRLDGPRDQELGQMVFAVDGRYLAAVSRIPAVHVWDTATSKEILRLPQSALDLAFSADHRFLVCLTDKHHVFWELATGQERCRFSAGPVASTQGVATPGASQREPLSRIVLSQDGRRLARVTADAAVRVWDVHSGKLTHLYVGGVSRPATLAFSPSARLLAVGSMEGDILVHDLNGGRETRRFLRGHHRPVTRLLFAPTGNLLLSASQDGTWLFWAVEAPTHTP
jgi:WD40 repeat protein